MKTYLDQMSFNDRVYKKINDLIGKYGKDSPSYDPENRPFAVFDWDNTSIIGDVEEALLYYMVKNLAFKMDPFDFDRVIRLNVSKDDFPEPFFNLDGEAINIDKLSSDIKEAYKKLYKTACPLGGGVPLDEIKKTNVYKEFVAKVFFRYQAAKVADDAWDMYCWMGFLLANYSKEELNELFTKAFSFMKKERIREERFTSPAIESKSGRVSLSYFVGLREVDEMANLFRALEENGIDAYVVSASVYDIVSFFATSRENIYRLDEDKVLGLRLKKDKSGLIKAFLDRDYPTTIRQGKVKSIKRYINKDRGPVLVAGDSDGDIAMMTAFDDTDMVLIVDRAVGGEIDKLKDLAIQGSDKYFLQARDRAKGIFIDYPRSKELI